MNRNFLYDNEVEKNEHLQAVQFLSEKGGFSEEEVLSLYEGVLEDFKREATIKNFLTVLVSRKVRGILQEKRYLFNA